MTKIRLRFVQAFVANGRAYHYFRKPGCARVKLPDLPGSEAFMTAYQAALTTDAPALEIGIKRSVPGTIAALVAAYISSDVFRDLRRKHGGRGGRSCRSSAMSTAASA